MTWLGRNDTHFLVPVVVDASLPVSCSALGCNDNVISPVCFFALHSNTLLDVVFTFSATFSATDALGELIGSFASKLMQCLQRSLPATSLNFSSFTEHHA